MYITYKYYVEIGFERYTQKVEITREKYEELNKTSEYILGWSTSLFIKTINGSIEIDRDKALFIRLIKETG